MFYCVLPVTLITRLTSSCRICVERSFGAPVMEPGGKHARTASSAASVTDPDAPVSESRAVVDFDSIAASSSAFAAAFVFGSASANWLSTRWSRQV
jgi:hypothetical protein